MSHMNQLELPFRHVIVSGNVQALNDGITMCSVVLRDTKLDMFDLFFFISMRYQDNYHMLVAIILLRDTSGGTGGSGVLPTLHVPFYL